MGPRQRRPAARGQSVACRKVARQMALVGEAGGHRRLRQGQAGGDHRLRLGEAPADLEAMRRGAESGPKLAGQSEAVEAADLLEFLRAHRAMRLGGKKV